MIQMQVKILLFCVLLSGKIINSKIILESCGKYGDYNSPTKLAFINITNENGKQFLNYHIILAEDLDAKIGVIYSLEYAANKKNYVKIRSLREKNACRAMNAYGGEAWLDIQKAAGIPVKVCPIKAGNYIIRHLEVDVDKMAFQAVPIGRVRINITMIHNSDRIPFMSSYMEITRV